MNESELPEVTRMILGDPLPGPSSCRIRETVMTYLSRMTAGDVDGVVALMSEDVRFIDPAGSAPRIGREVVRTFLRAGLEAVGGIIEMHAEGAVRVASCYGAVAVRVRTPCATPAIELDSLDVIRFGDDGLITELVAYWGLSNIRPLIVQA